MAMSSTNKRPTTTRKRSGSFHFLCCFGLSGQRINEDPQSAVTKSATNHRRRSWRRPLSKAPAKTATTIVPILADRSQELVQYSPPLGVSFTVNHVTNKNLPSSEFRPAPSTNNDPPMEIQEVGPDLLIVDNYEVYPNSKSPSSTGAEVHVKAENRQPQKEGKSRSSRRKFPAPTAVKESKPARSTSILLPPLGRLEEIADATEKGISSSNRHDTNCNGNSVDHDSFGDKFDPMVGLVITLVAIIIMLVWGRLCAIVYLAACSLLAPRLRRAAEGPKLVTRQKNHEYFDMNSYEYKKKIVLWGFLERSNKYVRQRRVIL